MKRRELIRRLNAMGCILVRRGAKHDWYQNPESRGSQPVPRHTEIKDTLAYHIIRRLEGQR